MLTPVQKQRWVHSKEPSKQLRQISVCGGAKAWPNLLSRLASLERASNAKQRVWASSSALLSCQIRREAARSLLQLLSQGIRAAAWQRSWVWKEHMEDGLTPCFVSQIHANCRIRRVYFSDRLYSEDELPAEFKLYLPVQNKAKVS